MIYATLWTTTGGEALDHGVFLTLDELAKADADARTRGQYWSGTLATNIALNRRRHNQCPYCGANVGQEHKNCVVGVVNQTAYVAIETYTEIGND